MYESYHLPCLPQCGSSSEVGSWGLRPGSRPSSASSDVLRGQPYAKDRPADVAYGDEYVASGPRLRGGVDELKPVAAPHDPGRDLDGGLGRDLMPGRRDRTRVADQLVVVDVDIGAEHLLGAQERRQVLLHSNNCTTDARPSGSDRTFARLHPRCSLAATPTHSARSPVGERPSAAVSQPGATVTPEDMEATWSPSTPATTAGTRAPHPCRST